MLRKSLHIVSRQLFYVIAVSIMLALLGVIAAMWLSDEVSKRKDEIAAWASQQAGYPVSIESAGLYWYGLIPKLQIDNIAVHSTQDNKAVVTAKQVYLSLDIIATLKTTEPVIADVSVEQAALTVSRDQQGQFHVIGLESNTHAVSDTSFNDLLRRLTWLKRIELNDIELHYQDQQKTALSGLYQLGQARLSFAHNRWQMNADFDLPAQLGSHVSVSGSSELNDDYTLKNWQARLQTEDVALARFLNGFSFKGLSLTEGEASLVAEVSQLENNITVDMTLALHEALLHSARTVEVGVDDVLINRLQGRLTYQQQQDQWQLQGDNLQIEVAGEDWPVTSVAAAKDEAGNITASADYLRLSDLTSVALMLDETPPAWRSTKPAGDVSDFNLVYSPTQGLDTLQFGLQDMVMLPWQDYPGVSGLTLAFNWQDNEVNVSFNSHETSVYADSWLKETVFFDSLTGDVSWKKGKDDNWTASAKALQLINTDLNLQLSGDVSHQQSVTDTDITLQIRDMAVNRWNAYVPERILPADFKEWADGAFLDGTITSGTISMQGNPSAFPFDEAPEQGRFDMQLQVENTQLHYADGWPDLTGVKGQVSGQGNNLLIDTEAGNIAGFAFNDVSATIENLVRKNPMLQVDGLLNGTSADALAFLQNSPLKPRFGSLAEWLNLKGNSDIQLGLVIPLVRPNDAEVQGHVTFANSELTTKAVPGLNVDAINGLLTFTNDGVAANNIQARAFSEPVTIDVSTANNQTVVKADSRVNISSLNTTWPGLIPAFVSGKSAYTTEVTIAEPRQGEFDVAVGVSSQLKGVSIDAPAPVGKAAEQDRPFQLMVTEGDSSDELRYQISMADWVKADIAINDGKPRGQVVLGGGDAVLAGQRLSIQGKLAEFDLNPWLDWQKQQPASQSNINNLQAELDMQFGKLILPGAMQLDNLLLQVSKPDSLWRLDLTSPQIRGQITVPQSGDDARPITANLDYLKLSLPETDSATTDEAVALWPSMAIDIAQLDIDGLRFGQLNLKAVRQGNQWQLQSASLKNPVMNATANGSWTKGAEQDKSQFDVTVTTNDVKGLFAFYDFQQAIDARQAKLLAQLSWSGSPLAIRRDNVQGTLDLSVGRGSLMNVDPGAAGRVFGLLSISALPRRLLLDFSDLFGGGFDFSAINGKFILAGGVARTSDLTMLGDSAVIQMNGSVDIYNKTYDQQVKVTPKVSSALPIAGAVAGGPIGLGVGTAILLFDKIAGNIFDREIVNLITYSYQLKGPWENPEVHIANPDTP